MEGEHDRPTLPQRLQEWRYGERPFSFRLHLPPCPVPSSVRPSVTVASDRQRVRPLDRPPADAAAVVRVRPSVRPLIGPVRRRPSEIRRGAGTN